MKSKLFLSCLIALWSHICVAEFSFDPNKFAVDKETPFKIVRGEFVGEQYLRVLYDLKPVFQILPRFEGIFWSFVKQAQERGEFLIVDKLPRGGFFSQEIDILKNFRIGTANPDHCITVSPGDVALTANRRKKRYSIEISGNIFAVSADMYKTLAYIHLCAERNKKALMVNIALLRKAGKETIGDCTVSQIFKIVDLREKGARAQRLDCTICMDRDRDTLIKPCNHFVGCAECISNMLEQLCPFCRDPIASTEKVFF